jgi:hypothetical protein
MSLGFQEDFNRMVEGMKDRLLENPTLVYVAVNLSRALSGRTAVTVYRGRDRVLCPAVRLDGLVWSATVKPPARGPMEPLNFWIESDSDRVEIV